MKRFQFSLHALLIIIALVAVYFAGRSGGFDSGYRAAKEDYGIVPDFGVYDVSDLVIPLPDETK